VKATSGLPEQVAELVLRHGVVHTL
jgi:hypothetical protein